jgi:hypothetical protein
VIVAHLNVYACLVCRVRRFRNCLRLTGHLIETGFGTPKDQLPTALQTRIVRSKHGIISYAPPEEVLNIFRLKRLCRISRLDLLQMLFYSVLAPKQAICEGVF